MGDWETLFCISHMVVCLIVSVRIITSAIRERKETPTQTAQSR